MAYVLVKLHIRPNLRKIEEMHCTGQQAWISHGFSPNIFLQKGNSVVPPDYLQNNSIIDILLLRPSFIGKHAVQ